ncbi:hypothetical protein LCGC14_1092550 [marine sediment metagenome]|uniref:Uncharacterized protein n=1 Tax=marine sediment metagenome TaxID=412755 RepID=A0A0F9MBZ4_9ZZZZ
MAKKNKPGELTIKRLQEREKQKQENKGIKRRNQSRFVVCTIVYLVLLLDLILFTPFWLSICFRIVFPIVVYITFKRYWSKRELESIILTPAEEERLEFVGFALSKKFKYYILMLASDVEIAVIEGREVHGYMERMFPDYYWLIDNDVLDRACYMALQDYQPVVHNHIADYDLPNMYRSLVLLTEKKAHFDHFREFEFDRIVILSDEPLRKDLTWIPNYEWKTDDGYDTTVTYAPCNLLNMGSPLHDLPIAVVKDALGKSKLYFKAKTSAEDLTRERDELIRKEIYKIREKDKGHDEIVDELTIESRAAREKYSNLKQKMLSRDPSTNEEKFRHWEKEYDKHQEKNVGSGTIDYKKLLIGITIIVLLILLIMGFMYLFTPKPPSPSEIPETAILISNLFKKGCN